ncbi:tetratricopeptide repeat protein [Aliivibrio salmonicida]|uniref:tetratricopeptide repeat protein n=1 Tax=Aliivibrio salmonicida TaxID=40269 RepID=UPI003D12AA81
MSFFKLFSKKKSNQDSHINSREVEGEKLFRQGLQYSQMGNQEEGIRFFTKSIEISPKHSSVYVNRGGCYMIQERYLEAYDDFIRAIEMERKGLSVDAEPCTPAAINNIQRIHRFIEFEKKTGESVRNQLTIDGNDRFTQRWTEILFEQFLDNDVKTVWQFIYEEIKELEEMGGVHQEYALNCGLGYEIFSNVTSEKDTERAFILFKSVLCCFSRTPDLMFQIRTKILDKLMSAIDMTQKYEFNKKINFSGRMHLAEAEVDIMFIIKNDDVLYINKESDHLYEIDKDGDMKLDGRVVNFIFRSDNEVIEIFVAFDEQDSYLMFTMNIGKDERLNSVAQSIVNFMGEQGICNVFFPQNHYSSQYHYTFKLYKKSEKHFMVNNSQSQAYLISDDIYKNKNVDDIKNEFWN